jgi:hypothetical protein
MKYNNFCCIFLEFFLLIFFADEFSFLPGFTNKFGLFRSLSGSISVSVFEKTNRYDFKNSVNLHGETKSFFLQVQLLLV